MERRYKVQEVAQLLDVTEEHVLALIDRGDLEAVNVAINPNGERPRWRIGELAIAKFAIERRNASSDARHIQQTTKAPKPAKRKVPADTGRHV